jgi:hypothetical protein
VFGADRRRRTSGTRSSTAWRVAALGGVVLSLVGVAPSADARDEARGATPCRTVASAGAKTTELTTTLTRVDRADGAIDVTVQLVSRMRLSWTVVRTCIWYDVDGDRALGHGEQGRELRRLVHFATDDVRGGSVGEYTYTIPRSRARPDLTVCEHSELPGRGEQGGSFLGRVLATGSASRQINERDDERQGTDGQRARGLGLIGDVACAATVPTVVPETPFVPLLGLSGIGLLLGAAWWPSRRRHLRGAAV